VGDSLENLKTELQRFQARQTMRDERCALVACSTSRVTPANSVGLVRATVARGCWRSVRRTDTPPLARLRCKGDRRVLYYGRVC